MKDMPRRVSEMTSGFYGLEKNEELQEFTLAVNSIK